MKIVVIGASGRTGRLVVQQALNRGDEVVAYVRNSREFIIDPRLVIAVGLSNDYTALRTAISDADAVLVCLGTSGKRMAKEVDLMQKSLPLIIKAMKDVKVRRLVLLSAYGVGDSARTAGFIARVVYKVLVPAIYKDKERAEALLPSSGLEWTCIYPVMLTDAPLSEAIEVRPMFRVKKVMGMPKVSRANVARIMLDAARDVRTVGQTLLVTSKGSVV